MKRIVLIASSLIAAAIASRAFAEFSGPSVQPLTCAAHQWINQISGALVPSCGQPAVADVTGAAPTASPTFTGTVTMPDSSTATSSGLGSVAALGVGETAPSAGNVNIAGVLQKAGTTQLTSGTRPTHQVFTSGTNATYTTPAGATWIEITLIGGGAGGGGGNSGTAGGSGNPTCWNTSGTACTSPVYQAGGGIGGNNSAGGGGGTISGSGTCDWSVIGGSGAAGAIASSTVGNSPGGAGGNSAHGGGGGTTFNNTGGNAPANSGGGAGGGGQVSTTTGQSGGGGGAGATCHVIINSPAASYTYTVGTGGTGQAGGTGGSTGGNGAAGLIVVYEHYGS